MMHQVTNLIIGLSLALTVLLLAVYYAIAYKYDLHKHFWRFLRRLLKYLLSPFTKFCVYFARLFCKKRKSRKSAETTSLRRYD